MYLSVFKILLFNGSNSNRESDEKTSVWLSKLFGFDLDLIITPPTTGGGGHIVNQFGYFGYLIR